MSCSQCGYFFQVGQDSVISVDSTQSSVSASPASAATMSVPVAQPAAASNPAPAAQNSPMPAVSNDRSELRLFWMNRTGEMPVQIPQNGATLGAKGALLKKLPGNTLFMIWHTRAGWYLRCIQGALLYNGKPVNLNNDMRLLNNDLLIIGSEQFRVEVI